MVNLFGVLHGCEFHSITGVRQACVIPSDGLISALKELPKGKIGLEWLSREDWRVVEDDLEQKGRDAKIPDEMMPRFTHEFDIYWGIVLGVCRKKGDEVLFLEDVDIWKRYNKAIVDVAKIRAENVCSDWDENTLEGHKGIVGYNINSWKKHLVVRKIHEIDRDLAFLEAIRRNNLDRAIVGLGHSDYWMANQQEISDGLGISFDRYATEKLLSEHGVLRVDFSGDDIPNLESAYARESLDRMLRVVRSERISTKKPDYIGIWDVADPLNGYFELFIEKRDQSGVVGGGIEDCTGSAKFAGEINDGGLSFTKIYNVGQCVRAAIHDPIKYEHEGGRNGRYCGHFYVKDGVLGDFGTAFYLTKNIEETPLQMSANWFKLIKN